MDFTPKKHYVEPESVTVPVAEDVGNTYNVYYRKDDGKLGQFTVTGQASHKDAITTVKEALVAEGDGLEKKAVLAVITGGSNNDN